MEAGRGSFRGAISNAINNDLPANGLVVSDEFGKLIVSNYSVSNLVNMSLRPNKIIVSNNTGLLQASASDSVFSLSRYRIIRRIGSNKFKSK